MTDKEMVSDNTFAVLRENYAAMSACYDEVMELRRTAIWKKSCLRPRR